MAEQKSEISAALQKASEGLLFPSESDAPFEVVEWPGEEGKPTKERMLELAGLPANTQVKTKGLASFFAAATKEETWHDAEERAEAQRFKQLVQTLKANLKDIKVFQTGKPDGDVYIVGRTDSGWAGLKTRIVET